MNPQDGYIQYIVNPKSGASSDKRLVCGFKDYLSDHGFEVRMAFTESARLRAGPQAAVDYQCIGVCRRRRGHAPRAVIHGLEDRTKFCCRFLRHRKRLLANELGFDLTLATLIRTFEGNCTRPLDLGLINCKCFYLHRRLRL